MYAIRSYYARAGSAIAYQDGAGGIGHDLRLPAVGKGDRPAEHRNRRRGDDGPGPQGVDADRITSYNVCYTKLLRTSRPLSE